MRPKAFSNPEKAILQDAEGNLRLETGWNNRVLAPRPDVCSVGRYEELEDGKRDPAAIMKASKVTALSPALTAAVADGEACPPRGWRWNNRHSQTIQELYNSRVWVTAAVCGVELHPAGMKFDGGIDMFCPECGYKNRETSKFCQGCGNRLEGAVARPEASAPAPLSQQAGKGEEKNIAPPPPPPPPSPGAALESPGEGFWSIPPPQQAAPVNQPKNAQFTESPGQSCPQCGHLVAAGKSFCTSCGNKMEGVKGQPAPAAQKPSGAPGKAALSAVGVGLRAVAGIIDSLVFMILGWIMAGMLGTTSSSGFDLEGAPFFALMLLALLYYVVLEGTIGATLGKLLIGLRVVKTDGSRCGIGPAIIRNLLRIVDAFPFFYLLGIILIAFSRSKQRLGDRVADTMVVKRSGGSAQASRQ